MQEQERAENTLQRGIKMKGEDLDGFIALYEQLTREAGYDHADRLCLKFFTDGLPNELYRDILRLDRPRNYSEWREAALERQVEFVHCKNRRDQLHGGARPVKLHDPFAQRNQRRDPNAMDTSADRGRIRVAGSEDADPNNGPEWHRYVNTPQQPPFKPREGYLQRQRENKQRDMRGVQCFNCQKYGHISRYCSQKRQPRPAQGERSQIRTANNEGPSQRTPNERANDWLHGLGGESDEVKDMVLQTMWKREDFPDA